MVAWYRRAGSLMWLEGTDMPCATTPEYNNLVLIAAGRSLNTHGPQTRRSPICLTLTLRAPRQARDLPRDTGLSTPGIF